jgi:serine/threonine-protein kinase
MHVTGGLSRPSGIARRGRTPRPLTQVNYLLNPSPDKPVHLVTTAFELLWIFSSLRLRLVARSQARWERVRMIWILVDVTFLTAILRVLGATVSSLVIGYPMLIAASGLWNRGRLVWTTTGLSVLGYGLLALDMKLRLAASSSNHHPDIILAGLALTGLVIAQQVRRIRALAAANDPSRDGRLATATPIHDA